ncbi:1-(5-phosphoribosyl)-5-[(5-phosphoribosylamino)methylideneamino]imidazole-4-carboxamide isomerase [Francisellaceae bacterium]|nr:1-(5-phosphoribosyl)-5-[(5-phosphoribosylamino)methylideneamino]imidazole-4-carboxamide isomerase [Francisellaceae bacterium]
MRIIPAIDLKSGKCVRLNKGKFDQIKVYSSNPVGMAMTFEEHGAKSLHIVDLDGAKNSQLSQLDVIKAVRIATRLNIQVGGGVKDRDTAEKLLDHGVDRVVIGSLSVSDIPQTKAIIEEFGSDKIVLALDVNINDEGVPMVATHGWQQESSTSLDELIEEYKKVGLKHVLCTDISRDGMLTGPNLSLYQTCVKQHPKIQFQASGGVSSLNDLKALKENKLSGVIIGKAIYENKFTLDDALNI